MEEVAELALETWEYEVNMMRRIHNVYVPSEHEDLDLEQLGKQQILKQKQWTLLRAQSHRSFYGEN